MKNTDTALAAYVFLIIASAGMATANVELALRDLPGVVVATYGHSGGQPCINVDVLVDASVSYEEVAQKMGALLATKF